jgi:hypothetical protein
LSWELLMVMSRISVWVGIHFGNYWPFTVLIKLYFLKKSEGDDKKSNLATNALFGKDSNVWLTSFCS